MCTALRNSLKLKNKIDMRLFSSILLAVVMAFVSCTDVSKVPKKPVVRLKSGGYLQASLDGAPATSSSDTLDLEFVTKYQNNGSIANADNSVKYRFTLWEKGSDETSFFSPIFSKTYSKVQLIKGFVFNRDIESSGIWPKLPSREPSKNYMLAIQAVALGVASEPVMVDFSPKNSGLLNVVQVYDFSDNPARLVLGKPLFAYGYNLKKLDSVKIDGFKLDLVSLKEIGFGEYKSYGLNSYSLLTNNQALIGKGKKIQFFDNDKVETELTIDVLDGDFAQQSVIDSIVVVDKVGNPMSKYCSEQSVKVTSKKSKCLVVDDRLVGQIRIYGKGVDKGTAKIAVNGPVSSDVRVEIASASNDQDGQVNGVLKLNYDPANSWSGRLSVSLDGSSYVNSEYELRKLLYAYIDRKKFLGTTLFVGSPVSIRAPKDASKMNSVYPQVLFAPISKIRELHYKAEKYQRTVSISKGDIIENNTADAYQIYLNNEKDTLQYKMTLAMLEQDRIDGSSGDTWSYFGVLDSTLFINGDYGTIETLTFNNTVNVRIKGGDALVAKDSLVTLQGDMLVSVGDTAQVWIGDYAVPKSRYKKVTRDELVFSFPPVEYTGPIRVSLQARLNSNEVILNGLTPERVIYNRGMKFEYKFFYNKTKDKALTGGYDVLLFDKHLLIDASSSITSDVDFITGSSFLKFKMLDRATLKEKYGERIIKRGTVHNLSLSVSDLIDSLGFYLDNDTYHKGDSLVFTTVFQDYKGDTLSHDITSFILDEEDFHMVDFRPLSFETGDIVTLSFNNLPNNTTNTDLVVKMGSKTLNNSSDIVSRGKNWIKVKVPNDLPSMYGKFFVDYTSNSGGPSVTKKTESNKKWHYDYQIQMKVIEEKGLDNKFYFTPKRHGKRTNQNDALITVKTNASTLYKSFGNYTLQYRHKDSLEWVTSYTRKLSVDNLANANQFVVTLKDLEDDLSIPKAKDANYDYKWTKKPKVQSCSGTAFEITSTEDFQEFLVPSDTFDIRLSWSYDADGKVLKSSKIQRVVVLPKGLLDESKTSGPTSTDFTKDMNALREFMCNLDSITGTNVANLNWLKSISEVENAGQTFLGVTKSTNSFLPGIAELDFTALGDIQFHSSSPIKGLYKLVNANKMVLSNQPTMHIRLSQEYDGMTKLQELDIRKTKSSGKLPAKMCNSRASYLAFKLREAGKYHEGDSDAVDCKKVVPSDATASDAFFDEFQSQTQLHHILGNSNYPTIDGNNLKNNRISYIKYTSGTLDKRDLDAWDLSYVVGGLDSIKISGISDWKGIPKQLASLVDSGMVKVDFSENTINNAPTKFPDHIVDYAGLEKLDVSKSYIVDTLPVAVCEKRSRFGDFVLFARGDNPLKTTNKIVDCDSYGDATGDFKINYRQADNLYKSAVFFAGQTNADKLLASQFPFRTLGPNTHKDFKVTVNSNGFIKSLDWQNIYTAKSASRDSLAFDTFLRQLDTLVVHGFESLHGLMLGGNFLASKGDQRTVLPSYMSKYRELDSLSLFGNYLIGKLDNKVCDQRQQFTSFKLQLLDGNINDDLSHVIDCSNSIVEDVYFQDRQALLSFADMMRLPNTNVHFPNSASAPSVLNTAKFNSDINTSGYVPPTDGQNHEMFNAVLHNKRVAGLYFLRDSQVGTEKYTPTSDASLNNWVFVGAMDSLQFLDIRGFAKKDASLSGWFINQGVLPSIANLEKLGYIRIADSKIDLKMSSKEVPSKHNGISLLDLQGNRLEKDIPNFIHKSFPYLTTIDVSRNLINTVNSVVLPRELYHLNLDYNDIKSMDMSGMDYLQTLRMQGVDSLKTSDLGTVLTQLPSTMTFIQASYSVDLSTEATLPDLSRMKNIEVLDLSNTGFKIANKAHLPINTKMYLMGLASLPSTYGFTMNMNELFRQEILDEVTRTGTGTYSCAIIWHMPGLLNLNELDKCVYKRD